MTTIWILMYENKRGTSVSVWNDGEAADRAMTKIAYEQRGDWDIPASVGDREAAVDWFEYTDGNENIVVDEKQLLDASNLDTFDY